MPLSGTREKNRGSIEKKSITDAQKYNICHLEKAMKTKRKAKRKRNITDAYKLQLMPLSEALSFKEALRENSTTDA